MKIKDQHLALLEGFLEELDWFIGTSRDSSILEQARDQLMEIMGREGVEIGERREATTR